MTGFDYIYASSQQMIDLLSFSNIQGLGIVYLIVGMIFIIGMVWFIVPYIDTMLKSRKEANEALKKRQLMNKIVLQKNLEDIIAKELERGKK
ncbi:hypothetical protein KGV52_00560 [Candidatus Gracilibacteria bacterium]|nr:hypothetical protein [Candidatus Gracilibacteria bacterium]